MAQQYGLGRGLASLIPPKKLVDDQSNSSPFQDAETIKHPVFSPSASVSIPTASVSVPTTVLPHVIHASELEVPIDKIVPNPHQPRMHFDEDKLKELMSSIQEHGILQPLIVSEVGEYYELIAGERRLQSAKKLGLRTVPVVVRSVTEQQKLELAIIENIQRHNLNPIEEAKAYLRLLDEFGLHQEAVAQKMGKSRSGVANTLRLLHLPVEIQRAVASGKISEGHAKALLSIENPEKQRAVFDLILKEEMTVRETEVKVRSIAVKPHVRSTTHLHPDVVERMDHLTQILGTKVKITSSGKGGKILIEYYSPEDLDGLLRRLEK
ncbi:MAG: ParB/RepB/Spo0J family partition protein [Minisyncoccota bacterium]